MSRHRVARVQDLWAGEIRGVNVGRTPVVLVNVAGVVCAYQDRCPHRGVPLSRGRLEGGTLICGSHEWCFDARTGRGLNPRNVELRVFPVSMEDDDIYVDIGDEGYGPQDGDRVGPVLQVGSGADAVVAAIRRLNQDVEVLDRGSYLRVLVRGGCRVTRDAIEAELRGPFSFPADLERLMPSFKGRLSMTDDEARWDAPPDVPARGSGAGG